uniref:Uncharacterized protein n=1 Tax=Amphiprion ocellaris TaxID=80972 RepID=A0AAQ5Y2G6_AMPOC
LASCFHFQLTGWRKYFNSYTAKGRRNKVLPNSVAEVPINVWHL